MFWIVWLGFAVVTALAAPGRGRSGVAWFGLGLLFGVFALIAVLVMPPVVAAPPLPPLTKPPPDAPRVKGPVLPPYHAVGSGEFDHEIVGESHYQPALREVVRPGLADGKVVRLKAALWPEPDNPHDSDAVRVEIGTRPVGYLPRDAAAEWVAMLARSDMAGKGVAVDAEIRGGFTRDDGSIAGYGVWLDLDEPYAIKRFY